MRHPGNDRRGANVGEDERWMTYDEVAKARGGSRDSAIRWVQRRKLRRQPGNDGRVRVLVPPDSIVSPNAPPVSTDPVAAFQTALDAIREAHAGEVRALREDNERLRQAEAERRSRGRLRRAWDGWMGR